MPLCPNTGTTSGCSDSQKAIVVPIIGFSNCDQETCGGALDAWDPQRKNAGFTQLSGQPCATKCPNLHNADPLFPNAWNEADNYFIDPILQASFIKQLYGPNPVGHNPYLVVWDGALGSQNLSTWDPTDAGYYATY